jgi:type II secretory pathway pseudopilin PulG
MKKNNLKKAFTLPEVVITLSVTIVVLAFITSLAIIVSNVSKAQTYSQNCQAEYQDACNLVDEFVNTYSTNEYDLSVLQTESGYQIVFNNGSQTYQLTYNKNQKVMSAQIFDALSNQTNQKNTTFENIENIVFTKQNNLIKCEYYFNNYPTFTNLVVFGVD